MWIDAQYELWQIIVVGISSYISLIILLQLSGKRTLSKLNAFDFVITIALGSTLSSTLISKDISYMEGLTAFVILIGLQFLITWASVWIPAFRNIVTSEPTLVYHKGQFLEERMKKQRLTKSEVLEAMRKEGFGSTDEVSAVVLETDGTLSVLRHEGANENSTIKDIITQ